MRVLIIDDEEDVRKMVARILQLNYHCQVDLVENIEQGLMLWQKNIYNIIFFDYLFVGEQQDGFNLLFEVKRSAYDCVTVMISGFMDSREEVIEGSAGIAPDEFIPKPFSADAIKSVMDKYCAGCKCRSSQTAVRDELCAKEVYG